MSCFHVVECHLIVILQKRTLLKATAYDTVNTLSQGRRQCDGGTREIHLFHLKLYTCVTIVVQLYANCRTVPNNILITLVVGFRLPIMNYEYQLQLLHCKLLHLCMQVASVSETRAVSTQGVNCSRHWLDRFCGFLAIRSVSDASHCMCGFRHNIYTLLCGLPRIIYWSQT